MEKLELPLCKCNCDVRSRMGFFISTL